jgi:hypothetical protein
MELMLRYFLLVTGRIELQVPATFMVQVNFQGTNTTIEVVAYSQLLIMTPYHLKIRMESVFIAVR